MPTGKTITAKEAGVFLPGMRVRSLHRRNEVGTCIVPSQEALAAPRRHDEVYVCWPNGDAEWVYPNLLEYVD